jgi:hypothetical protein
MWMTPNKLGLAAAAIAAAGALGLGGAALANAATTPAAGGYTASPSGGYAPQDGTAGQGRQGQPGQQGQQSTDTVVTGDEATKVSAAVTAKDSAVTVDSVRKDPDGSYDVLGTKDGAQVMFDVSADLATVTQAQGGGCTALTLDGTVDRQLSPPHPASRGR